MGEESPPARPHPDRARIGPFEAVAFDAYATGVMMIAIRGLREQRVGLPWWRFLLSRNLLMQELALWQVCNLFSQYLPTDTVGELKKQAGVD